MKRQNTAQRRDKARAKLARVNTRPIIAGLIIIFFVLLSVHSLKKYVRALEYFQIDEVVYGRECGIDLSFLKGVNIFKVDIRRLSAYIALNHPRYRQINIVRVLPNRIFLSLKEREAIALVKLHKYFSVDREAVLFEIVDSPVFARDLPVITGLKERISGPRLGKRYKIKEMIICLNLIRRFNLNKILSDYRISRVHMDKLSSISIFMRAPFNAPANLLSSSAPAAQDFEVRIDAYNIRDKFELLAGLLRQEKGNLSYVKYIDLRFKDPVIKFSDDKPKGEAEGGL